MNNDIINEINELDEQYKVSLTGRKQILSEIKKRIELMRKNDIKDPNLRQLENHYSYRDYYISDYKLVMNILLRLANNLSDKYEIKEVCGTDFVDIGGNEIRQIYGKTLVITEQEVLNQIEDKLYKDNEFSKLSERIINDGHSMIIVTYNYFDGRMKPRLSNLKDINKINIKNGGLVGDISCYLHNDELYQAVSKFMQYIELNGPDFTNIDEDTLYELIINSEVEEKVKRR